jgi:hypothetical protein
MTWPWKQSGSSWTHLLDEAAALEFKSIDFEALSPIQQNLLVRATIEKVIFHQSRLTFFIKTDDLGRLRPFKKENYFNTRADSLNEDDFRFFASSDGLFIVAERKICVNQSQFSNRYVGKGKKLVSITENGNNLIKALSYGFRYGKMHREGMSLIDIGKKEHKSDRTIYRSVCLNYVSPNIVNSIFDGRVPAHVDLQALFEIASKYPDFKDQESCFKSPL